MFRVFQYCVALLITSMLIVAFTVYAHLTMDEFVMLLTIIAFWLAVVGYIFGIATPSGINEKAIRD